MTFRLLLAGAAVTSSVVLGSLTVIGFRYLQSSQFSHPTGEDSIKIIEAAERKSQYLHITNLNISTLDSRFFQLCDLQHASLSNNHLSQHSFKDVDFGQLVALKHLALDGNIFSDLCDAFCTFPSLSNLNLNFNQLYHLNGPIISRMRTLTSLSLAGNQLNQLPPELGQLSQLTHLDVSFNGLTSLPEELSNLRNLQHFTAANNKLVTANLSGCHGLIHLDFNKNQLRKIGKLCSKSLVSLRLSNNLIQQLPDDFFDSIWSVSSLNLTSNELTTLPSSLPAMTLLRQLHLDNTRIRELPAQLFQMTSIQELTLTNTPVETLDGIQGCLQLKTLKVSPSLKALPPEITTMTDLRCIDVRSNKLLRGIPEPLTNSGILLHNCPWTLLKGRIFMDPVDGKFSKKQLHHLKITHTVHVALRPVYKHSPEFLHYALVLSQTWTSQFPESEELVCWMQDALNTGGIIFIKTPSKLVAAALSDELEKRLKLLIN